MFQLDNRRLVLRYDGMPQFSFRQVNRAATDTQMHQLAQAFASIQTPQPTKILTVDTFQLL